MIGRGVNHSEARCQFNRFYAQTISFVGILKKNSTLVRVKKLATNPSVIKKICQLTYKSIALYNIVRETSVCADLVNGLKGVSDGIDFYGTYKNICYWINPFSKKSIDRTLLETTLQSKLEKIGSHPKNINGISEIVSEVVKNVFEKSSYRNPKEVRNELTKVLTRKGYADTAVEIVSEVSIKQKSRPVSELIMMFCFTAGDLCDNIGALKKWGVLDYTILTGKIAASVGNQSRVFTFIYELGLGKIGGMLTGVALFIAIGSTTYKLIVEIKRYIDLEDQGQRDLSRQKMKALGFGLFVTTWDFTLCVAPMLLTINPVALVTMAITSKCLGLIKTCCFR